MKNFSLLVFIFISQFALAIQLPLRSDLRDELEKADFITIPEDVKANWLQELDRPDLSIEKMRQIVNQAINIKSPSHGLATQPFEIDVSDQVHDDGPLLRVFGEKLRLESPHAIKDLQNYIKNRVGKAFFEMNQKKGVETFVLGSVPSSLKEDLVKMIPKGSYSVMPIPSVYEKWGLYRYWIQSRNSAKAYYVLLVPPSLQYVRHYTTLFSSMSSRAKSIGYLNEREKRQFGFQLKAIARQLRGKYGDFSVLFFGYERNWLAQLKKPESPWALKDSINVRTEMGLNLHFMHLIHRATQKTIKVAALQPDQTVWGELASEYYRAFFELNPKVVIFMGSAGALRTDLRPYQLSVPREFYLPDGKAKIQNWFLSFPHDLISSDVLTASRHGLTYSPAQQTKKFVQNLSERGIGTIDVEQAVVARTVYEHNLLSQSKIQFGAVNIITDIPGQVLVSNLAPEHFDLDFLNTEAKAKAKDEAARIALNAMNIYFMGENRGFCRNLFQ